MCTHTAPWCKDTRTPVVFGVCLHIHPHVWCVKGQACAYLWGDKGAGTQCSDTRPLGIGNSHAGPQVLETATQAGRICTQFFLLRLREGKPLS